MKTINIGNMPEIPFNLTESLNQLRINLRFCGQDKKVIMVSSSMPNEGKSFIALQLWKQLAEAGQKTLLIDCDLRGSVMRQTYGLVSSDKMMGLAYYLSKQAEKDDVIYGTDIRNAYMIPVASTVANPTILLEGNRFEELIEECKNEFDYIIVDTPPLGIIADGLSIATVCDGTLLVVRSNETGKKVVDNSVQLLKRTGTPLLGIVLNRVDMKKKSGGYYGSYGKYGYGEKYYKK